MESAVLSTAMQDYLETILEISDLAGSARISDIAAKLNIAKASVTQAVQVLRNLGLVNQDRYGPVELTQSGREQAIKVRNRHRALKMFLTDVLGVNAKIAEEDACKMEHVVSPHTMERLVEYVDKVGRSQMAQTRGEVAGGKEPAGSGVTHSGVEAGLGLPPGVKPLSQVPVGDSGTVVRVTATGTVRRRIIDMGVTVGTVLTVKGTAPMGDPIEVLLKGYRLSLRKAEAALIQVEVKQ